MGELHRPLVEVLLETRYFAYAGENDELKTLKPILEGFF
jgi:hypothetical protein